MGCRSWGQLKLKFPEAVEVIVNVRTQPFGIWCWVPRFHQLPEDLAHLFFHRVAVIGSATTKPITHGVVEVADPEGGHGSGIASSAVPAVNARDCRGRGLAPGLLD